MTKTCTRCKKELPATTEYFYKNTRNRSVLKSWCKRCVSEYNNRYRGGKGKAKRERLQQEENRIREYTDTSSLLIATMLLEQCAIKEIAKMLDRDETDLKRYIKHIRENGELQRKIEQIQWYRNKGLPNAQYW